MGINATPQQWEVLLQLLNAGMRGGCYDLGSAEAIAFWTNKIKDAGRQQEEEEV